MALGWRKEYLRYSSYFLNILAIYKTRKDVKMFMEIVLTLVTLSLFISLALRPTVLTIIQLTKQIKEKEETIKKMDQKIQNLQLAQSLYLNEQENISLLNISIPDNPEPEVFVNQLTGTSQKTLAKILNLALNELTLVGKPKKIEIKSDLSVFPENTKFVSFNLSLSGSFGELLSSISGLENLLRPITVDTLSLSSREGVEGKELTLSISGRSPYINMDLAQE